MEFAGHPAHNHTVLADLGKHPELAVAQIAQITELTVVS